MRFRFVFVAWKPGQRWNRGRTKGKGTGEEECAHQPSAHTSDSPCPIFLRTVTGRTVVVDVAGCTTSELLQRIEMLSGVPQRYWYCRVNGSALPQCEAGHGLQRDSTVTMCARLKGGAPAILGEWFCQVCQRGGCWPARTDCFRCNCKRSDQVFEGAPPKGPAREKQAMGQIGSPVCPTERRPPPTQKSRKPARGKLDQQVILEALGNMGLPLELMQQLRSLRSLRIGNSEVPTF